MKKMKKILIWTGVIILMIGSYMFYWNYFNTYSEGNRAGTLQKFSKKVSPAKMVAYLRNQRALVYICVNDFAIKCISLLRLNPLKEKAPNFTSPFLKIKVWLWKIKLFHNQTFSIL